MKLPFASYWAKKFPIFRLVVPKFGEFVPGLVHPLIAHSPLGLAAICRTTAYSGVICCTHAWPNAPDAKHNNPQNAFTNFLPLITRNVGCGSKNTNSSLPDPPTLTHFHVSLASTRLTNPKFYETRHQYIFVYVTVHHGEHETFSEVQEVGLRDGGDSRGRSVAHRSGEGEGGAGQERTRLRERLRVHGAGARFSRHAGGAEDRDGLLQGAH